MRFVFSFLRVHISLFSLLQDTEISKRQWNTELGKESKIKYSTLNNNKRYWRYKEHELMAFVLFFFSFFFFFFVFVQFSSAQFSSVAQSCPPLCNPMNRSTPGLPVHHQLPEITQTHVHQVSDAIQPSHPLSSPSPPAPNPSQHQSPFQWVNSSHEVAKVLKFQL